MELIEVEPLHLTVKGTRSFLPEFLARALSDRPGRAFLVPENRASQAANDQHFTECFHRIATYLPTPGDLVFIDRSAEVGAIRPRLEHLTQVAADATIPLDHVIYVSQNPKAAVTHGLAPRWLFFHHYVISMSRKYRSVATDDFGMLDAGPAMLCLNGKVRPQRLAVAAEMHRLFGDRAIITWQGGEALYSHATALQDVARCLPSFEHIALTTAIPPLDLPNSFGVRGAEDMPKAEAIESFLHVVTETDYMSYTDRITEKSLKPIAAHRPFVVFGPPHALERLRDLGFKTFGGVIDESYDEIENPDDRLKAVIRTLVDLTRQDHRDVLRACYDICAANQAHLRNGLEAVMADRLRADLTRILEPRIAAAT